MRTYVNMEKFVATIEKISNSSAVILSFGVLLLTGVMIYEVISRFIFSNPTKWAFEMVGMIYGVYGVLAGGYLLLLNKHIRVDVFFSKLSEKGRAIADLATAIFSFTFVIVLLWFSIPWAWRSLQTLERASSALSPPVYPLKIILVISVFWLAVTLVVKVIRDIYTVKGTT